MKESRFARDKQISREYMHVNSDFSDPLRGKFASHYARAVRFIFDRSYCAKLVRVLLFRVLRALAIINTVFGSDGLRDSPAYIPG